MKTLCRVFLLVAASAVLGLLRLAGSGAEVARRPGTMVAFLAEEKPVFLWDRDDIPSVADLVVVDGRAAAIFARGHPPSAVNVPYETRWETVGRVWDRLHGATVLVVMEAERAREARELASFLARECAAERVATFRGGWAAWFRRS